MSIVKAENEQLLPLITQRERDAATQVGFSSRVASASR